MLRILSIPIKDPLIWRRHITRPHIGMDKILITDGKLNLGIWQGIYLCEHRNYASGRNLVLTAFGV